VVIIRIHVICILDSDTLALAIEGVNLLLIGVIECLVWEVLSGGIHENISNFRDNYLLFDGVYEMVVGHPDIVEQVYEDLVIVVDEATRDERISKTRDRNSVTVKYCFFLAYNGVAK